MRNFIFPFEQNANLLSKSVVIRIATGVEHLRGVIGYRPHRKRRSPAALPEMTLQLFAGLYEADAIALIFEAAGKVEFHPTIVLALILTRRWTTSRTIKVDAPRAASGPDPGREEFNRIGTVVDSAMDVGFLLSESRSGWVDIDITTTTFEG